MTRELFQTQLKSISRKVVVLLQDRMRDSGLNPGNKTALTQFMNRNENEIQDVFCTAFAEELNELISASQRANIYLSDKYKMEDERTRIKVEIENLAREVERLKKEKETLEEKYSNPNAREAVMLWEEIIGPYRGRDTQVERNAILSAGQIVAAVFGGKQDKNITNQPIKQ